MNELEITYRSLKKLMNLREDLLDWARCIRIGKLSDSYHNKMLNHALQIDELLRKVG